MRLRSRKVASLPPRPIASCPPSFFHAASNLGPASDIVDNIFMAAEEEDAQFRRLQASEAAAQEQVWHAKVWPWR